MEHFTKLRKLLRQLRFLIGIHGSDEIGDSLSDNLLGNPSMRRGDLVKREQPIKLKHHREQKLTAHDDEEVEVFENEDSDSVPEEMETEIASQLQGCCNEFGEEKLEMLQQSAGYLLELGKLYKDYAINGKGKQQILNFVKSAALINGAIVRYKKLGLKHGRNASKNELQKLHLEILKIDHVKGDNNMDFLQFSDKVKTVLEAYRKEVYEKLNAIIEKRKALSMEKQKEMVNSEKIKEICELSTERYLDIMRMVANKCEAIMGNPPCKYSFIGLGSLARNEATLYSEFQHAILLEDNVEDDPAIKEYFRWFTAIFHIIIIGLSETPISSINVRSLNDHYSSDKSKNWFSDSCTPHGITFDGVMPHVFKIPFDRQQATVYRTRTIELIQSAWTMANLVRQEDDLKNRYSLRETLRTTCLLYGNQEVYNNFSHRSHWILYNHRAVKETAKQQSKLLLCPSFVMQQHWFLYYIQEKITSFISAISALWEFKCQSSYEIVDQMKDYKLINVMTHRKLRNALGAVMEARMKCYQIRCCQNKLQIDLTNLIEEKMMMDCFVTVISLTVELQRQLDKASTCPPSDGLWSMEDDMEESIDMEESMTLSAPAFEVVIKEVEFGLVLACRNINSYVRADARLASSEAKLAIKTASLILTTYFDQIFFTVMDGRVESLPNILKYSSIGSILESLESHCRTLLRLTDENDGELLVHYYPMMFLLHCIQNQFSQALEKYARWQKLRLKQKVKSIDLPSTYVSLKLLHIHIMTEALDANDMMTRIEQMISTESDYQGKCFLKIGLCLAKLKTGSKRETRKDLNMLVRDIKKNPTKFGKEVRQLLLKNILDIQLAENFLVDAAITLHEEISSKQFTNLLICPILDLPAIQNTALLTDIQQLFQNIWEENLNLSMSLLEEYQPHILQSVNSADPLECGFSLALALSLCNQRKCASLLWKILHDPTVTEFLKQESVVWILHILSYQCGSIDADDWITAVESADTEEKTSNQETTHSPRGSFSLPQPEPTGTLIHRTSSVTQDLETIEAIIASESKTVLINKEGGKIEIGGCAVSFPPVSFDDVAEVYAKAEINSSKWPPKYFCITAMLWVKSQRKLLRRASVSMKSWCMKNCSDSRKILVDVLHQKIGSSKWDVVASLPLNDLKIFHFECTDFSPYILGVHEGELSATDLVVESHVYAGRGKNFSFAFFLQHDLIEKNVKEAMAEQHREIRLNFTPLPVKENDKISASLKSMDDTFRFPKDFKKTFIIDGDFVRLKKKAFFHSLLIGSSNKPCDVPFECGVWQNDTLVDENFFNYEWWPKEPAHTPSPALPSPASISIHNTVDLSTCKEGVMTANKILTGQAQDSSTHYDENNKATVGDKVVDTTMKK